MLGDKIIIYGLTGYLALTTACTTQSTKEEVAQRFANNYSVLEDLHQRNEAQIDNLRVEHSNITVMLYSETDPNKRGELEFRKKRLETELGFNGLVKFVIGGEMFNAQLGESLTELVRD